MRRVARVALALALTGCSLLYDGSDLVGGAADAGAGEDASTADGGARDGAPRDSGPDADDCDRDGDGARAISCGGDDCDDTRADIRPGVGAVCGDGLIDCDDTEGIAFGADSLSAGSAGSFDARPSETFAMALTPATDLGPAAVGFVYEGPPGSAITAFGLDGPSGDPVVRELTASFCSMDESDAIETIDAEGPGELRVIRAKRTVAANDGWYRSQVAQFDGAAITITNEGCHTASEAVVTTGAASSAGSGGVVAAVGGSGDDPTTCVALANNDCFIKTNGLPMGRAQALGPYLVTQRIDGPSRFIDGFTPGGAPIRLLTNFDDQHRFALASHLVEGDRTVLTAASLTGRVQIGVVRCDGDCFDFGVPEEAAYDLGLDVNDARLTGAPFSNDGILLAFLDLDDVAQLATATVDEPAPRMARPVTPAFSGEVRELRAATSTRTRSGQPTERLVAIAALTCEGICDVENPPQIEWRTRRFCEER